MSCEGGARDEGGVVFIWWDWERGGRDILRSAKPSSLKLSRILAVFLQGFS